MISRSRLLGWILAFGIVFSIGCGFLASVESPQEINSRELTNDPFYGPMARAAYEVAGRAHERRAALLLGLAGLAALVWIPTSLYLWFYRPPSACLPTSDL